MTPNRAASIHARLLNRAKAQNEDFNLVLSRYAIERFLYRLSLGPGRERFLLKGGMLFHLWFAVPHRPTRDADLLGFGPEDAQALAQTMRNVCAVPADDGMQFDTDSVVVEEIRDATRYGGLRVRLSGRLGNARYSVQLDVGYGDAVTPGPDEVVYPVLLDDLPPPNLRVYPRATVAAEKLEAIVHLGMANSRMKDYFDLRALAQEGALDAPLLAEAIVATFERRGTPLPDGVPLGLSDEFATDAAKQAQWRAFLGKNRLAQSSLEEVVAEVRDFVEPALHIARQKEVSA